MRGARSPSARRLGQQAAAAAAALALEAGETVLESFLSCQLLQTYTPTNNFFSPLRQASGDLLSIPHPLCMQGPTASRLRA